MELREAMRTARAIRRYRPDAVPDEELLDCLEAATFAPSGSNLQPWRFLILRSAAVRSALGTAYRGGWDDYAKLMGLDTPTADDTSRRARFIRAMYDFSRDIDKAPVYVMFCAQQQPYIGDYLNGASIFPAVQNFMLAVREKGLGTVYTTWYTRADHELRACVGIPADWNIAAVLPVGYPRGRHGPVRRRPVAEVVAWETWNGRAP
jgi:nitroreductase